MEGFHQSRDKIEIDSNLHDKTLEVLYNKMREDYSQVDTLDGIKAIIDENSWILIRKSNTEDIIRISSESNNSEKCKSILEQTKQLVKQSYEQVK